MSQPPYPPQGGHEGGGERPGQGRNPPGDPDEPTRRFTAPQAGGDGQRDETRQFGSPGLGPQPGGPPYGQQPAGPRHRAPYGAGQPPYGPPPYGPPPYGPPPSGPPPYGQHGPPWGPPGGQPPTRNRSTLIALAVAGVVILAAVGIAIWLLAGGGGGTTAAGTTSAGERTGPGPSSSERSSPSSPRSSSPATSSSPSPSPSASPSASGSEPVAEEIPPPTVPPEGLGEDPLMDAYAQECFDGDMVACDSLFRQSPVDSAYEDYGDSCAGRQPIDTDVFCSDAFPAE